MLRYLYFRTRYSQWFKNQDGIKAFAQQCIHWIMRNTLQLAAKLKKQNSQLAERINTLTKQLNTRAQSPTIEADDFPTIQREIRNYTIIERCIIIAEAFFNYFASMAIFTFRGWLAIIAQVLFSIVLIVISIPLFRNLFEQVLNEPHYGKSEPEPRSFPKLIFLVLGAIVYEISIYSLCKLRGEQIEGQFSGFITVVMIIVGMMLPILAGYFAYERRKYYSPYINTCKINRLRQRISFMENKFLTNLQKMENHFKKMCQALWAYLQEFKTYKENYNRKHGFPEENLCGHFCEIQRSFIEEAIERYKKEALLEEGESTPGLITIQSNNRDDDKIRQLFIN